VTGSRADGAPLNTISCNGSWWQTWQYVDYQVPDDTDSAATQKELTVYAGTMCMAPQTNANGDYATSPGYPTAAGSTWPPPPHTLMAVYYCDASDRQKWDFNADGTIRPAYASNLCLERPGGLSSNTVELNTCRASSDPLLPNQQWVRPAQ
jgi:hypothetical protein